MHYAVIGVVVRPCPAVDSAGHEPKFSRLRTGGVADGVL